MREVKIVEPSRKTILAKDMYIGQIGIAGDGEVLLRCDEIVVSLSDPSSIWHDCRTVVRPVPVGSVVSFIAS